MLNTSVKRILALVLCLALTISCGSMARAARETSSPDQTQELTEEEVRKHAVSDDQSVYVLTDAAGSVNKIIVSDKLKDAVGNEALSQETVEAALPVDVKISYRLDGQEISPEELAGKSGKAVIRIDYSNNQSETEMVNGASQKLYVPFLMVSALLLDGEHFKNVTVENGRLVNDGTRSVVVGYALPGLAEDLALDDTLDVTIPDHVEITADVTDFQLGSVYTIAANNLFKEYDEKDPDALKDLFSSMDQLTEAMTQLMDGASALNEGLDTLLEQSDSLTEGVGALSDGASKVADGAGDLSDGASKVADGAGNVKDGADKLAAGAGELLAGTDTLASGADSLSAGLSQISSKSGDINDGAAQVFRSLLSAAQTQLASNGLTVSSLTISNYQEELEKVIASLDDEAVYQAALKQVTEAVEAKRPEIREQVAAAVREEVEAKVTAAVKAQVTEQVNAAVRTQVTEQVEANRSQIEAQVTEGVKAQVAEQVTEAVRSQILAQVISQVTGLDVESYQAAVEAGQIEEATQNAIAQAVEEQMAGEQAQAAITSQTEAQMNSEEIKQTIADTTEEKVQETISAQLASPEVQALAEKNIDEQMASDTVQTLVQTQVEQQMGTEEVTGIIDDNTEAQVQKAIADTMAGEEVQGKLKAASEGAQAVMALKTSLDQYNAFYLGVKAYTAAVDAATQGAEKLSDGVKDLKAGVGTLSQGASTLAEGTGSLAEGADSLANGAAALKGGASAVAEGAATLKKNLPALIEGITKLRDGSATLKDGLTHFDEEGIRKLTSLVDEDVAGLSERLKATARLGRSYHTSLGAAGDVGDGEVKFIYRTESIGE
ncbi:MAG: hypothetical protein IJU99_02255 [Lachnospiraceae bacterium]|nr:hypothetical protein [Lachnospiraceae bacterium]